VVAVLIYCQVSAQDAAIKEIHSSASKEIKNDTAKKANKKRKQFSHF